MKINETYLSPRMSTARVDQRPKPAAPGASKPAAGRFDTVLISTAKRVGTTDRFNNAKRAEENPAATRLRESISLDVRSAAASAADQIPALREQIQSGTYQIDARAIARKILSMGVNA